MKKFINKIYKLSNWMLEYFTKVLPKSFPVWLDYLQHNKDIFENELAIVAIIKNEEAYLKEWIEYHMQVGVEKFYIYDDENTDNTQTILKPYIDSGKIIYKKFSGGGLSRRSNGSYIQKQ